MNFIPKLGGDIAGILIAILASVLGFKYLANRYKNKGRREAEIRANQHTLNQIIKSKQMTYQGRINAPINIDDDDRTIGMWRNDAITARD